MPIGSLTNHIDLTVVVLWIFWLGFAALIFYLRREDRREGYPLMADKTDRRRRPDTEVFPIVPDQKAFALPSGDQIVKPDGIADTREPAVAASMTWAGAPMEPTGNPMLDGIGPASYAERRDEPDLMWSGEPKIVPMRADSEISIAPGSPDPRGMEVIDADGQVAGKVVDAWVDRADDLLRYFEVEVPTETGTTNVLVPNTLVTVPRAKFGDPRLPLKERVIENRPKVIKVHSILASQFKDAPKTRSSEQITLLEEDRIMAYFGSGHMYAKKSRAEPVL